MIVVTTPTGDIGSQVLRGLVDAGETVRVIARDSSSLPADVRNAVEIIQGSHSDANVLNRAFDGADRLFWLVPSDPRAASAEAAYVDFARPACEALKHSRITHVVSISALGRGWTKDAGHVTATLKMDDMLAATGVGYRALTCASLMENVKRQAALIKNQQAFYWPFPQDQAEPACATRDVAAVAVDLLKKPTWSGVEEIPMLGPEDLSFRKMMAIASDVLGQPIEYHEMSDEDLRGMMLKRGASEGMASAMVNMMLAKKEGIDHLASAADRRNNPTTFRTWCEDVLRPAVLAT
ncbi:NAD(P)H-binding protein [Agrobacterium vitis]|uniref:NAD(P)H-binding protein n=1 Tax=Agrobacterium vitis TaxID=373 RepID=UPI0012E6F6B9|nr:NAD(P)H-binding protein [Agrobacterium vitis]MVA22038.1 NAD(P)H-binding protein [Agrobacterium vitis]